MLGEFDIPIYLILFDRRRRQWLFLRAYVVNAAAISTAALDQVHFR
jgi:hypothetical protein